MVFTYKLLFLSWKSQKTLHRYCLLLAVLLSCVRNHAERTTCIPSLQDKSPGRGHNRPDLAGMAFSPLLNPPGGVHLSEWLFLDHHFSNLLLVTGNRIIKHPSKLTWNFICMKITKKERWYVQHTHKILERHVSIFFFFGKTLVYEGMWK